MPKGKSNVPKNEPKDVKLVRLAKTRTNNILKAIKRLANLSRLKPTPQQTEQVFGAIKKVAESAYSQWKGEKAEDAGFDFNK
jgi:hypothetical protein